MVTPLSQHEDRPNAVEIAEESDNSDSFRQENTLKDYMNESVHFSNAINSGAMGLREVMGPGGVVDKKFIKLVDAKK